MMTLHATSVAPGLETIEADLPAGTVLHLWLKARTAGKAATLFVTVGDSVVAEPSTARTEEFELLTVTLTTGGRTVLAYDASTATLSVAYAFRPRTVFEEGIRVLHRDARTAPPAGAAGYHFRPPFGWMNDPNGFGRFSGRIHLFYQHYPHGLRWNTMHWGHAVSDDGVRWRHMPVFLPPSPELAERADGRGGAFSGSAIPLPGDDGGIRVFFTEQVKDRVPEEQIQLTAISRDGIATGPSEVILPLRPEGLNLTTDFRDPYVFKGPDGRWKMLLGSRDRVGGVVLLYETSDPAAVAGWTFLGILQREDRYGMTAAECPCLVPLDGPADDPKTRWALIFCLLTSRDPATGRRNISHAIVGRFDGVKFVGEFERELDFGTDAYAFQAFVDRSGPVGIAWLANWTDISRKIDFPTAMTLPRRLLFKDGLLLTPPVEAVDGLRRQPIDASPLLSGETVDLHDGAVEIVLELRAPGAAFDLAFDHPDAELGLRLDREGLSIVYDVANGREPPRYVAAGAQPSTLRIFLDKGSIEVFADDGRWAGTKRLPGIAGVRSARLISGGSEIAAASIWRLAL